MTTDQTDHRAEADRLHAKYPFDATEHLLAALHDGQAEQTEWLHRIRDLLAVMAEPKGDPCPCGCRRDVEPKPLVSRDLTEMQDRLNATLTNPAVDAALNTGGHVGVDGAHEAGGCEDCSEPEPDAVTVSLPERILGRPWTVRELRMLAEWADNAGSGEAGSVLGHVADALDAANTPPASTSAPVAGDEGEQAPEGGQDAGRAAGGDSVVLSRADAEQVLSIATSFVLVNVLSPTAREDARAVDRFRAALNGGEGR